MTSEERLQAARVALKTGNLQAAMDGFNILLAEGAHPQLFFERGLVAHLGGAAQAALNDYRSCLALDPGHLKARENIGQILRRTQPFVGPSANAQVAGDDQFVYAVGASHVRSFSSTTSFLPLWLGPANDVCFVTPDRAVRTEAHLIAAIERCDLRNPVLLVMGDNDLAAHFADLVGTKKLQAAGELGSDAEILQHGAQRYLATIETIRNRFPGIRLVVLGGFVNFSSEQSELIRAVNVTLAEGCARIGVEFVDYNDQLADPETGTLRADVASHADNSHLSKETVVRVIGRDLSQRGLLPPEPMPFEWSFLWQAPLPPAFVIRIWGEPHTGANNLVHSRTVAFNHVTERALHVLLGTLALHDGTSPPSVLVPYAREGLVPLSLPIGHLAQVTGVSADAAEVATARRLAAYFGRPDLDFRRIERPDAYVLDVEPHDYVFVALRDEPVDDPQGFLDGLLAACRHSVVVLSTIDWSSLEPVPAGARHIFPIADGATRPPWDKGTILIQRRG
jgi:hypothetical protein